MYRKSFFLSVVFALVILAGCKKEYMISDHPFMIDVSKIGSEVAFVDVVPESNDFWYYTDVVQKASVDKYGSDAEFIAAFDGVLKWLYETNYQGNVSFFDAMLYNGAYLEVETMLSPDTEWVAFAYPYDGNSQAVQKLEKVEFKTKAVKKTDLTLDFQMNGSVLSVTPSNNDDTYFWEYEEKSVIEKDYDSIAELYYADIIKFYYEYDFFPGILSKGPDSEDFARYFDLKPGDEFCLFASGYDGGKTTDTLYRYVVKYTGPDTPGEITLFKSSPAKSCLCPTPSYMYSEHSVLSGKPSESMFRKMRSVSAHRKF